MNRDGNLQADRIEHLQPRAPGQFELSVGGRPRESMIDQLST